MPRFRGGGGQGLDQSISEGMRLGLQFGTALNEEMARREASKRQQQRDDMADALSNLETGGGVGRVDVKKVPGVGEVYGAIPLSEAEKRRAEAGTLPNEAPGIRLGSAYVNPQAARDFQEEMMERDIRKAKGLAAAQPETFEPLQTAEGIYKFGRRSGEAEPLLAGGAPLKSIPKKERTGIVIDAEGNQILTNLETGASISNLGKKQPGFKIITSATGEYFSVPETAQPIAAPVQVGGQPAGQPPAPRPAGIEGEPQPQPAGEQPSTKEPEILRAPPPKTKPTPTTDIMEARYRKEFTAHPTVKEFRIINTQIQRMDEAFDESKKSGSKVAVDQALVTTFNKIQDPTSVVMVSEYARTAQDVALLNRVKGKFEKIMQGGAGFTDEERAGLHRMAERFYDAAKRNYDDTTDFYRNVLDTKGIDPALILSPIARSKTKGATPGLGTEKISTAEDLLKKYSGQ